MNKKKRVYKYANGGLLKDSGYVFNSLPQYGLGSWLGENAGTIGSVAGAGLSLIPGVGPLLGAAAGAAGNMIGGSYAAKQQEAEQAKLVADQEAQQRFSVGQQNAMSQYQAQSNPMYGAVFACGGKMRYADGGMIGSNAGGQLVQDTKGLDNVTVFANGGSHENNIKGGITLGNRAQVEQNEVRFGDYIFSDRLPYKK